MAGPLNPQDIDAMDRIVLGAQDISNMDAIVGAPAATAPPKNKPLTAETQKPGLFGPEQALFRGIEALRSGIGKAAAVPFRLAGQLDVASGIKTPEQAESRAQAYGNFSRDLAEGVAVPWSKAAGLPGFLARMGQGAGLAAYQTPGDFIDRLKGAAWGAGTSLGGDIIGKTGRFLLSPVTHRMFSDRSGEQVAQYLRQNVPAWKGMTGKRALYDMARETGQTRVSNAYEAALKGAAAKIPAGITVNVPARVATRAGFMDAAKVADSAGFVAVDARRLLKTLPTLGKDQETRRQVLNALNDGLPPGVVPADVMTAYKVASGWIDFAKKGRLFSKGEQYDAAAAMKALREYGKETLERRGLGTVRQAIRGPLAKPIEKVTAQGPLSVIGALTGGLSGGSLFGAGGGGGGLLGGAWLGQQIGQKLPAYRNVPQVIPQLGQAGRAAAQAVRDPLRELIQSMLRGRNADQGNQP